MLSKVRVPSRSIAIGGWRGIITIDGDVMRIVGVDGVQTLDIDVSMVKRYSFNGQNGLWVFRMKDGRKLRVQSAGALFSADRSPAGWETNAQIRALLRKYGPLGLTM